MKPSASFVELDKSIHDRKGFDSGKGELNQFLRQFASRHREAGISKTMVLHYPIPVMLIAQLAVHRHAQGQGLGKVTLTSPPKLLPSTR